MKNENKHTCTICQSPYTEDQGGCEGDLGIMPVQFCPFCLAGLFDMVEQLNGEPADEADQPA